MLPEIQALRAVAVAIVVIYHVWPTRLTGGFIGVDVFFVISGFLITAHLLREQQASGRIRLRAFWARRIRRLLPASFLVLAVCAVAAVTILPSVYRAATLQQIAAASGYLLNWELARNAVDYLAADDTPTLVQHFWSLSVEEQFYVLWPVLMIVAAAVAARLRSGSRGVLVMSSLVVVGSLVTSVLLTAYSPALAYFNTGTRAWEFALGGLVAALAAAAPDRWATRWARHGVFHAVLTVAGFATISIGAALIRPEMPFPGALALVPCLGAVAVLVGGMPRGRWADHTIGARPVQYLGDISYSLYLWHWPIIVGFAAVTGRPHGGLAGGAMVVAAVALAMLTKRFVEDPSRRSTWFAARRRRAFAFALVGLLVFVGLVAVDRAQTSSAQAETQEQVDEQILAGTQCRGADAMLGDGAAGCVDRFTLDPDIDLAAAAADLDWDGWCLTWFDQDWNSCELGDPAATHGTLALVGDSHAAAMAGAFDDYFRLSGWKVVTFTRFSCPGLNTGQIASDGSELTDRVIACHTWSDRVRAELARRDDIDRVVFLNNTASYTDPERPASWRVSSDEILETWRSVLDSGKDIVVVRDVPRTVGTSIPECLATRAAETAPCSTDRDEAVPDDIQDEAMAILGSPRVRGIDLTDAFCDQERCYAVIGGVVVYADDNHVSGRYAASLMPYLGPQIVEP